MNQLEQVKDYLQGLQSRIVAELEQLDGKARFGRDTWDRPGGGGGLSCVLSDGHVFEKAGVGFSHVYGDQMPPSATRNRPDLAGCSFEAVGVSLVIHPRNPYVPTTHANYRFFTTGDSGDETRSMKLGLSLGYSGAKLRIPLELVQLAERLATTGLAPRKVGERVLEAIRESTFYAFVGDVPADVEQPETVGQVAADRRGAEVTRGEPPLLLRILPGGRRHVPLLQPPLRDPV